MNHPLSHSATWQPCTGNNSVRNHLDSRLFPVSFRALIPQWKARGSPPLRTLRAPWAISSGYDAALDTLVGVTEAQEEMVIDAIAGTSPSPPTFAAFQNHLHIYCSVYTELSATQEPTAVYAQLQQSLLLSFELERQQCLAQGSHQCIGRVLWGDVYTMPLEAIKTRLTEESKRFEAAQRQARLLAHLRASWSQPASSVSPSRPAGLKGRAVSVAHLSDIVKPTSPPAPPLARRNAVYKPLSIDVASVLRLSSLASIGDGGEDNSDDNAPADVAVEDWYGPQRHSISTPMGSCWSASSSGSRDNDDGDDESQDAHDGDETVRLDIAEEGCEILSKLAKELAQFRFSPRLKPNVGGGDAQMVRKDSAARSGDGVA